MAYEAKTDWLPDDEIREDDLNRWEKGIDDAHNELESHKKDQKNPHRVTKKQVGLGNVDDVQQASKKDFEAHRDNVNNPHKVNSNQINVISAKSAAAKYNEYPKGITIAETGTGTSMGYPWDFIIIETEQLGENRTIQTIYDVSSATVIRSMVRKYREADGGWGEWAKTETEAAAQEKAIQALEAAKKYTVDNAQMHKLTQDNGHVINSDANLDDIKTTGVYFSKGAQGSPEAGKWGFLVVITQDTGRRKQIWRHDKTVVNYERSWETATNTWSEWVLMETAAGAQVKAEEAEKAAVSWAQSFGLGTVAKLIKGDLNTIIDSGFYRFSRGETTVKNEPAATQGSSEHSWMYMIVIRHNTDYAIQITWDFNGIANYIRIMNSGNWSNWRLQETTDGAQAKADAVMKYVKDHGLGSGVSATPSGQDLNAFTETGFYYTIAGLNTPSGTGTNYGFLQVMTHPTNPAHVHQIWSAHNSNVYFVRRRSDSVWTEWVEQESVAGAQAKVNASQVHKVTEDGGTGIQLSSSADLNKLFKTGFYKGNNITNAPTSGWYFYTVIQQGATECVQYATNFGTRDTYVRYADQAGNFNGWIKFETTGGAQSKADAIQDWAQGFGLGVEAPNADWNTIRKSGFYRGNTNGPLGGSVVMGVHVQHSAGYAYQTVGRAGKFYSRTLENGSWTPWAQIETTGGSQAKADAVKDWVKGYGLGGSAKDIQADINTIETTGFYRFDRNNAAVKNAPAQGSGEHSWMYMQVINHSSAWIMQMVWDFNNKNHYTRVKNNGTWNNWKQWEGSTEAQAKADRAKNDAVTAFKAQGLGVNNPGELTNLNDATVTGWRTFASGAANAPRAAAGVVETIYYSANYAIQKAYLVNSRVSFLRVKSSGTWKGWQQTAGNMEEGWQDLTPRGGANYWSDSTHPQVLRIGDHVFVRGALTNITSRGFLALTLPGYARPAKTIYRVQNTSTDGYKARFTRWRIEPSGDVYCEYNSDDRWEAGKWFPVDFEFAVTA